VVVALFTRSMQLGFYERAIHNVVSFYTGYLQVQAPGYQEQPGIERSFAGADTLSRLLREVPGVASVVPRLELFALVSSGERTEGALVTGIDPAAEDDMTGLAGRLIEGRYLEAGDRAALLASGLARNLDMTAGDTLVILGQGYHGVTAAAKYPVAGLVKFPTPDLDRSACFLPLAAARELCLAPGRVTSLALMISDEDRLTGLRRELAGLLGKGREVLTWRQMLPELVQSIEADNAGGLIMLFVIYMVIAFGMLGTILMMTLERTREFGMLMAVGMKRRSLYFVSLIEGVLLSLLGAATGLLLGLPVILYVHAHPIPMTGELAEIMLNYGFEPVFPMSIGAGLFLNQTLAVLAIALCVSAYPLIRLARLVPVSAMRGEV